MLLALFHVKQVLALWELQSNVITKYFS